MRTGAFPGLFRQMTARHHWLFFVCSRDSSVIHPSLFFLAKLVKSLVEDDTPSRRVDRIALIGQILVRVPSLPRSRKSICSTRAT
jgi:hypothetical protein